MRRTVVLVALVLGLGGCRGEGRSPLAEVARASAHHSELSHPVPIFNVRELRASQRYFRDLLGFKVDWEHGSPPSFGSVSRSEAAIFMCQGCQGSPGAWVFIFTADVDKLHRELASRKAIVKTPPTNMPWDMREMQVADLDGNVMRFAARVEH